MASDQRLPIRELNSGIEIIDAGEFARRLRVPKTWVEEQVRSRSKNPIPHFKFGKYTRFAWGSPELASWLRERMVVSNSTVERANVEEKSR